MEEKIDKAIEIAKRIIPAMTVATHMQNAAQAVLNLTQVKSRYKMLANPTEEMNKELEFLLGRVRSSLGAAEMMQVTQAALNMIHAKSEWEAVSQSSKTSRAKTTN